MTDKKPFVVIVDDNADDRFFLNQALQNTDFGLDVVEVNDGEEAINFIKDCKNNIPKFILLDINMPKRDGFEVLAYARDHPNFCNSKIIMLSTSSATKDISRAKEMGAYDYLVKPDEFSGYLALAEKLKDYIY